MRVDHTASHEKEFSCTPATLISNLIAFEYSRRTTNPLASRQGAVSCKGDSLSRPAIVYLTMLAVLIAGLWTVLAIGRQLDAPSDLAGKWQLTPIGPGPAQTLNVEQSGKFFQIAFEHGPQLDLKLQSKTDDKNVSLGNSTSQLLVMNVPDEKDPDNKMFLLNGPNPGSWNAHRTVRTFPEDVQSEGAR